MQADILSLLIFGVCVILFILDILPMATTAILGCTAMVIFGVCDFKTAFGQFSSSTVILTIGVMIIGASISNVGLAAAIGNWIVRISKGSETRLIIGTYLVSACMSAFLTNSAVIAIFFPIVLSVSAANTNIRAKNLIMPIAFGCVIGGASTLVGSTQQMTAQGLLEEYGAQTFKIFDFTPVVALLILLGLFYCLFVGRRIGMRLWGDEQEEIKPDIGFAEKTNSENRTKMVIMAVIFCLTVIFYITEWLPIAVTSTAAALLCIVTGCVSQDKAVFAVNWNIVGRLAGCLGLAKALEAAGGTALVSDLFQKFVGTDVSPFVMFCFFVLVTQVISEFISNSTAILIVLPIVLSIAPLLGLNSYSFALGITIASGIALSCPLASSTLGMSMAVGYRFNDYFKYSVLFDILAYIVIIITIPLCYGLTV